MDDMGTASDSCVSRRRLLLGGGAVGAGLAASAVVRAVPAAAAGGNFGVVSDPNFYPRDDISPEVDLTGKVAVITGGSRGIGLATGLRLQAAGATVIGTSRTPGGYPGHPFPLLQLDVADPASVAAFVPAVLGATGGTIDILFNNAGRFSFGSPFPDPTAVGQYFAGIEETMATLYGGHIGVTSALFSTVAASAAAGYGRILFTCSVAAYGVGGAEPGTGFYHSYFSGKRALLAYANSLRGIVDAAELGVRISTVNPLAVSTDLASGARPIFLSPVDGSGNSADPNFQAFLDLIRAGTAGGLPASFAAEAVYQVLAAADPHPNIAVGSTVEPFATQGQNAFVTAVGTAEMRESAYPWAVGKVK